jgi:Protein of unknown function (DUF4013)
MDLGMIIGDAVRYPFSDWKKILILGILSIISSLGTAVLFIGTLLGIKNVLVIILLFVVGYFIVGFVINGYTFKIIKTSLYGMAELPAFNNWFEIFVDGIKVTVVYIVYIIPAILIIAFAGLSIQPILGSLVSNPTAINLNIILSVLSAALLVLIAIFYIVIILPINYMAIAHMAYNNSKFSAAFRFHDIRDKIGRIGWGNLIIWYIITGTIYIIITVIGSIITATFSVINPIIGIVLSSLIVSPYLYMFVNRSIALFYMSE